MAKMGIAVLPEADDEAPESGDDYSETTSDDEREAWQDFAKLAGIKDSEETCEAFKALVLAIMIDTAGKSKDELKREDDDELEQLGE